MSDRINQLDFDGETAEIVNGYGRRVAVMDSPHDLPHGTVDDQTYYAQLFCAAPALLASLIEWHEWYLATLDQYEEGDPIRDNIKRIHGERAFRALAALAAAKGATK